MGCGVGVVVEDGTGTGTGCLIVVGGAALGGDIDDADVVEVDPADGDVGARVVGPAGVDGGVGVDEVERSGPVVGLYVADGVDVGVAVQFCDAGDQVGVGGVGWRAWAGVGVDDHLVLSLLGICGSVWVFS